MCGAGRGREVLQLQLQQSSPGCRLTRSTTLTITLLWIRLYIFGTSAGTELHKYFHAPFYRQHIKTEIVL